MSLSSDRHKIVDKCVSYHELVILGVTDFSYPAIALKETLNLAFNLPNHVFEA